MRRFRFPAPLLPSLAGLLIAAALFSAGAAVADRSTANPKDTTPTGRSSPEQSSQGTATAPNAQNPAAPGSAAQQQMMEQMAKAAAPGPAHEKLKAYVGNWKATVKTWMGSPQPQVSEGTATMQMILGGRYLEQRFHGTFMNKPYEGYGLTGYDNEKGVYDMMYVDDASTAMMTGEGTLDDASKTLTMKSSVIGMDGKPMQTRSVMKLADPNTLVYSMYAPMNGQDQLVMEITYKRS